MRTPENILVIGTRPEAIKCAPLVAAFARRGMRHRLLVVFSGQQPALLESALPHMEMDLRMPDWPHGRSRKEQRAVMFGRFHDLFTELGCGAATRVIVQGDTSTSYLAALAARRSGASVHHVEAGLRSGSLHSPFPEEFHRRAIAQVASMHYAPTPGARDNLLREGVHGGAILVTGNTGIDNLRATLNGYTPAATRNIVLIALHRRENHHAWVHHIMAAVLELAPLHPELTFVWLQHSQPAIARELLMYGSAPAANVRVVEPLSYLQLVQDSTRFAVIMTDSGGLQEEAAHLGIPLMVLRDRTERPEALDPEMGLLCPPSDAAGMLEKFQGLVRRERRSRPVFGDGTAAERIVDHLLAWPTDPLVLDDGRVVR